MASDATPRDRSPAAAATCRNCGAHAPGHYCGNCGQETRLALPTFAAFMREAAGRYVSLDGRLWRTLVALLARPGFLTLEYLRGRRRHYIRPGRLFLVLYLTLFAVIGLVQSPAKLSDEVVFVDSAAVAQDAARHAEEATTAQAPAVEDRALPFVDVDKDLNVTLRVGSDVVPLPPSVRKRWDQFRKLSKEEKAERIYSGVLRYGPYAMVALLPAFALLLKLAYLGRGRPYPQRPQRYAEHLVYSAHLHAFAALMLLVLVVVPFPVVRAPVGLWVVYYAMRARHVVYGGRWWAGLLRALVVGFIYLVLLSLAMAALVLASAMLR
ncbi:MAG: DUF3667 domain-containing protein [Burkholderiales bacterium]|nr:DUF3667 domain-containing protein [Burkholderiales bacterium]